MLIFRIIYNVYQSFVTSIGVQFVSKSSDFDETRGHKITPDEASTNPHIQVLEFYVRLVQQCGSFNIRSM